MQHRTINTPWGPTVESVVHAPGITFHRTSSHGGIHLGPGPLAKMPDCFKNATFTGNPRWYEEDCDWAMVALVFPEAFLPDDLSIVDSIVKHTKPEAYAAFKKAGGAS